MTYDRRTYLAVLRRDLAAFAAAFFSIATGEGPFLSNFHIALMCYQLEKCLSGETTRLVMNLPPRYGKSYCTSVAFVAWALGQNPGLKIMCVSYGQDLANELASATRRIMQSALYREVFPNTRLADARPALDDLRTTAGGRRIATSVGGAVTGRGADIIAVDDPMRADDIYSSAGREAVRRFYTNTLVTRLNNPLSGVIVAVMQRLHVDDLTALLLEQGGFRHVTIPAIAPINRAYRLKTGRHLFHAGTVLDPNRDSKNNLESLRRTMGSARFEAQYQQNPFPEDGDLIRRSWFRSFDPADDRRFDAVVQSWDTATSDAATSAYSVCLTFGIIGETYYVLDVYRARLDITELRSAVMRLQGRFGADHVLVEHASSGIGIYQIFRRLSAETGMFPVVPCVPRGNKMERLMNQVALIEEGRVYLPTGSPFVGDYLDEILLFPNGNYDDCVDATTQFLRWVRGRMFENGRRIHRRGSPPRRPPDPNSAAARVGRLQGSMPARRGYRGSSLFNLFRRDGY
jgi:predicted phage terminase large subunit-like protein